jgi:hypothetical protein
MDTQYPVYTVGDYIAMLDRKEVIVNRDYQRSAGVWPSAARSFLVETVLLGYPVPKLYLHQVTDPSTLRAVKQVVDGQQRTYTLRAFLNNEFRLSGRLETEELRGKRFDHLSDDYKMRFLTFGLAFDLFVGASDDEVREIFRRMNSFTSPLNPEEQRHAQFQGAFKWFIRNLTTEYDRALKGAGVFGPRALIRMADAKLFTEMAHAYYYGPTTTDKRSLQRLYHDKDRDFPEEGDLGARLRAGLNEVLGRPALYGGPLFAKVHVFYSFVLATMHIQAPLETFEETYPSVGERRDPDMVDRNLALLSEALDLDDQEGSFADFVLASSEKTNVGSQRAERVRWLCRALTEDLAE